MDLADWVGIISAVIALLALLVAAWSFREGAQLQAFLTFTERYETMMSELPQEARIATEWAPGVDAHFVVRLRYLNLCSEQFYLRRRFLLSNGVWRIWDAEMRRTLASLPYREAWSAVRQEFVSYPEFARFVDACQRE